MNHAFSYDIIYSSRKTLAIQITSDGQIKVRAPKGCAKSVIHRFLMDKQSWILKHATNAVRTAAPIPELSDRDRKRYISIARDVFSQKVRYYSVLMDVSYGRISIREQKTRWGSCSSTGNMNFNWRLIFAPEQVVDYIVVHELAHRIEMNHSPAFYAVVAAILPEYKKSQKWLRENGHSLFYKVCSTDHTACTNPTC